MGTPKMEAQTEPVGSVWTRAPERGAHWRPFTGERMHACGCQNLRPSTRDRPQLRRLPFRGAEV